MGRKTIDLTGQQFERLKVIKRVENDKWGKHQWLCECDCNKEIIVKGNHLTSGNTKSCGCLHNELTSQRNKTTKKKYNTYDLSNDYGIGYTSNTNEPFYFELKDYDKIKNYCWHKDSNGYICTKLNNKIIRMHRLIMNYPDMHIDHINRNKIDNRKDNLRITNSSNNSKNVGVKSNNTSGVTGVSWYKTREEWVAKIKLNDKYKHLGYFIDKEDAIKIRLQAEKQYFKEFAPQQHLYEQYGII